MDQQFLQANLGSQWFLPRFLMHKITTLVCATFLGSSCLMRRCLFRSGTDDSSSPHSVDFQICNSRGNVKYFSPRSAAAMNVCNNTAINWSLSLLLNSKQHAQILTRYIRSSVISQMRGNVTFLQQQWSLQIKTEWHHRDFRAQQSLLSSLLTRWLHSKTYKKIINSLKTHYHTYVQRISFNGYRILLNLED